jgi:CubicO group peptidase (beta-lactamase class C family)
MITAAVAAGAALLLGAGATRDVAPRATSGIATSAAEVPPPAPVSSLSFDAAIEAAAAMPRLYSLLVSVDGELRAERYFNGATRTRATNIKSASKSIVATLVGIAIDRGHIPDVREPIATYFPDLPRTAPDKARITIEDLVTMRSGLETTSNRNYGRWVQSGNWVRHVLERPLIEPPGGRMIYSTGSTHLLSAILTRATRSTTLAFARSALGTPLGITLGAWTRDPQGIYLGGNEMAMRPLDMLKVGTLFLNGGRHEGTQIVSEAWVRTSVEPRTVSRFSEREYGYGWWIRTLAERPVFYAWGYGGQFIFIVPSVRTVVVVTSVSTPGSERREHLRDVYDLVEQHVIPVAATAFPAEGE